MFIALAYTLAEGRYDETYCQEHVCYVEYNSDEARFQSNVEINMSIDFREASLETQIRNVRDCNASWAFAIAYHAENSILRTKKEDRTP